MSTMFCMLLKRCPYGATQSVVDTTQSNNGWECPKCQDLCTYCEKLGDRDFLDGIVTRIEFDFDAINRVSSTNPA